MTDLVVRTTIVLAAAFAVSAVLRRATPATRHLLWHVTFLLIIAAPVLLPLTPRIAMPSLPPAATALVATPIGLSTPGTPNPSSTPGTARTSGTLGTLGTLWFSGFLLTTAWFAFGWLAARWIARRAVPAPLDVTLEARDIARDLRLIRLPDVRVMAQPRGPLTVGITHPTILLPALALDWSVERRRHVFAHELAHIRRADTRSQAVAHVACALYWFNPLVWLAARAMRRERERACDDMVIALGVRPSTYAQDLLEIARIFGARLSPSAALAMARRSELEGRLLSLLAIGRPRQPRRAAKWVLATAMTLGATVVFGAQQVPSPRAVEPEHRPTASSVRPVFNMDEARSDDDSAIPALVDAMDDLDAQVREQAAIGLAVRSSPDVLEPLLRAIRDPDAQVREKAAIGLSLRRDPRVIDALLIAIADEDAQVREKVAIALGTSGDPRAVSALKTAIADRDGQVREKAALGLVLLTSTPLGAIDQRAAESGLTWIVSSMLRAFQ